MNTVFRCKKFELHQNNLVFKITTDSMALGACVEMIGNEQVLEVGTGTGIISLMLAQRYPSIKLTAIDNSMAAISLANRNFQHSPWSERIQTLHTDFRQFDPTKKGYDLIVSNPPFYPKGPLPLSEVKKNSKHDLAELTIKIIVKASTLLNENGSIWLILPDYREPELTSIALKNGLFLKKYIGIHPIPTLPANRVIVCYTLQNDRQTTATRLTVYNEDRTYHISWIAALKDYMLIF